MAKKRTASPAPAAEASDAPAPRPGTNRRRWERVPAEHLPDVTLELSSGADVWMVDLSQGGARIRTRTRMLPGLGVTLKFRTPAGQLVVHGQIVRSSLVNLQSGPPGYEVGIAFDTALTGPVADAMAQRRAPRPGDDQ